MGFKKVVLVLPEEGFTGETVEHKVTATNLKNQPELAEQGIKEGDTIQVLPFETTKPSTGKAAAKTEDDEAEKQAKRAAEIAEKLGVEAVYLNKDSGEFFTSENLAGLSVKGDKSKLKTFNF